LSWEDKENVFICNDFILPPEWINPFLSPSVRGTNASGISAAQYKALKNLIFKIHLSKKAGVPPYPNLITLFNLKNKVIR